MSDDVDEGSAAMRGSVAGEPDAYGVLRVGGSWVCILPNAVQAETSRVSWDKMESWVHEVVPLYRKPQRIAARLPQVPDDFEISEANGYAAAIEDFKKALDAAGIAWTE